MLAVEFAKALECAAGGGGACDSCESCRRIDQGSYPDLLEVTPELETGRLGIEPIRALAGRLSLTPYEGLWKVGLIEGADRMTEEAANASLKLLEEPPEKSVLLLTAAGIHRLPATLVSRCAVIRCVPQGIERTALFLSEREGVEPPVSRLLAALSGGRLGLALEFHRLRRLPAKNALVDQLLTACRQKAPEIPLGSAPRAEVEEALEWLACWWRDLLLLALKADSGWVVHQDRLPELEREAASILGPPEARRDAVTDLSDRIEWAYGVQEAIQRNASPRIALAALFCRS